MESADKEQAVLPAPPLNCPPDDLTTVNGRPVFLGILGEIAEYTILGAFGLYVIGFLIWRSYLGNFGVSSVGFLQMEYLSAAVCYLLLFACYSLPPILICALAFSRKTHTYAPIVSNIIGLVSTTWLLLLYSLNWVFFDNVRVPTHVLWMFACFGTAMPLSSVLRERLRKRKSKSLLQRLLLNNNVYYSGVSTCSVVVGISFVLVNPNASWIFMGLSFLMALVLVLYFVRREFQEVISAFGLLKSIFVVLFCIVIVLHAQSFGRWQFGTIPRSVGGGKPERAFIKCSQHSDIPAALSLAAVTNFSTLSGFYGPVSVLLRSEKELVLVNFAEGSLAEYATNKTVLGIKTNTTTAWFTNMIPKLATNSSGAALTIYEPLITKSVTNTTDIHIWEDHIKNPAKLTAKQVRAELIDVVIYAK